MQWILSAEQDGLFFDRAWLAFTGTELPSQLGPGWREHLHPEDAGRWSTDLRASAVSRRPLESLYRLRRADGAWRTVLFVAEPLFDERTGFGGFSARAADVSDFLPAEGEPEIDPLLEKAGVGLFRVEGEEIEALNSAVSPILAASSLASPLAELAELSTRARPLIEKAGLTVYEVDPKGPLRLCPPGFFARRAAPQNDWRESADLAPLLEALQGVAFEITADRSQVLRVDGRIESWLGFSARRWNAPGFLAERVHPEDHATALLPVPEDAPLPRIREYRLQAKNGATRWVREVLTRCLGEGSARLYHSIWLDISEERSMQERVLEAAEREKMRMGQDLHDDLCQHLAGLSFFCKALENVLQKEGSRAVEDVREIDSQLRQAVKKSRDIARGLTPVRLQEDGLIVTLQDLAASISERFRLRCTFQAEGALPALSQERATHLYRITQEAVSNARIHGRAENISIFLQARSHTLRLIIRDDGLGIPAKARARTDRSRGMGLRNMQYRARSIGGELRFSPNHPRGTIVTCSLAWEQTDPTHEQPIAPEEDLPRRRPSPAAQGAR